MTSEEKIKHMRAIQDQLATAINSMSYAQTLIWSVEGDLGDELRDDVAKCMNSLRLVRVRLGNSVWLLERAKLARAGG